MKSKTAGAAGITIHRHNRYTAKQTKQYKYKYKHTYKTIK
jgi:hypothetical protein